MNDLAKMIEAVAFGRPVKDLPAFNRPSPMSSVSMLNCSTNGTVRPEDMAAARERDNSTLDSALGTVSRYADGLRAAIRQFEDSMMRWRACPDQHAEYMGREAAKSRDLVKAELIANRNAIDRALKIMGAV